MACRRSQDNRQAGRTVLLHNNITRRNLIRSAAAAAWGCCGFERRVNAAAETPLSVRIVDSVQGAVLNHRHGKQTKDSLTIHVSGEARSADRVTVNGSPCRIEGNRFDGDVALHTHEAELVAVATGRDARCEDRVRVVWDRYSERRYRFSIDDGSFFLRDIAQKNYASLFDCFFLKGLRTLHRQYGTRFCVNIYYIACDDDKYPADADFRLSQFPDRYRGEWGDNADWLKLAFHAYANMPPRPYQDAPPQKLAADMDRIAAEVGRFAGDRTLAPPPNLHYSMSPHSAFKPMYDRGVRELSGYFCRSGDKYDINYNWDNARSEYLLRHNVWKDFQSGIVFTRDSLICNNVPAGKIAGALQSLACDPNAAEVINLLTHE